MILSLKELVIVKESGMYSLLREQLYSFRHQKKSAKHVKTKIQSEVG